MVKFWHVSTSRASSYVTSMVRFAHALLLFLSSKTANTCVIGSPRSAQVSRQRYSSFQIRASAVLIHLNQLSKK